MVMPVTLLGMMLLPFLLSFFFCFLGPHLWHVEVPRLGVELELQLLATATATTTTTAMWDPSRGCDLYHWSDGGIGHNARSLTH